MKTKEELLGYYNSSEETQELLTEKQFLFLCTKLKRLNFLSGSVRSGKTYVSLQKFALAVKSSPRNAEFIITGKTLTALKRNCLNLLQELVGESNFSYRMSEKEGVLFGHKIWLEGANDEKSENKIRGMTLYGAYCDEVTLFPETFFTMLLSRLSFDESFMIATCNPDSPSHYIKTNYIDNEDLDIAVWNFVLTDNKFMGKKYIEEISKEYQGVFYNRFILGQWVRAEGIIYLDYANNEEEFLIPSLQDRLAIISIGIDYGASRGSTVFQATGIKEGYKGIVALKQRKVDGIQDPEDIYRYFEEFYREIVKEYGLVHYVFADWGGLGQVLTRGLIRYAQSHHIMTQIQDCEKIDILDRILLTQRIMGRRMFQVIRGENEGLRCAFKEAVWEEGRDNVRLDDGTTDIDSLDAFEYSVIPFFKKIIDTIMPRGQKKEVHRI